MKINDGNFIAQKTFRILVKAFSHPGEVYRLPEADKGGLMALLRTLVNHEVSICVIGREKHRLETEVIEIAGCLATEVSQADFILITDGESHGEISKAKRGELEYPDRGATVIYMMASLEHKTNGNPAIILKGPGIKDEITPMIKGVQRDELCLIKSINAEFPLGLDCIFVDETNRIMCIPRSAKIEVW